MKTLEEVDEALNIICIRLVAERGLSDLQMSSIAGAVAALSWVAENQNKDAMEALLHGIRVPHGDTLGAQAALGKLKESLEQARESLSL